MPIKEKKITKSYFAGILSHMRGCCGSCGMMEFTGLYDINDTECAKNILRAAHYANYNLGWNIYVICASAPIQTAKIKKFMVEAGWKVIKTFKQAHAAGNMTLWGGYAIP